MSWLSDLLGGASKRAGRAMEQGYQQGIDRTEAAAAQSRADISPFRSVGLQGLTAYANALGLNGRGAGRMAREDFQASPGYQFALGEGLDAIKGAGAGTGMLLSGETLKGLSDYGQGMANQEWGGYLNRLSGLGDTGLRATGLQVGADTSYTDSIAQLLGAKGEARASGIIGANNQRGALLSDLFSAAGGAGGFGKLFGFG